MVYNGEFAGDLYTPKNSELRQEYNRRLRERAEERQMPTGSRPLLPPVPAALQSDASSEKDQPRPAVTSATTPPSVLQRLGAISFSGGDWLILGLLIFFLFMTEETDYVMVGILAYLLLSD